jgi:hypothetical protein
VVAAEEGVGRRPRRERRRRPRWHHASVAVPDHQIKPRQSDTGLSSSALDSDLPAMPVAPADLESAAAEVDSSPTKVELAAAVLLQRPAQAREQESQPC